MPRQHWTRVDSLTDVLLDDAGNPIRVRSRARNLDGAFDAACQWWGAPLDSGAWHERRAGDAVWEVRCSVQDD